ncbi:DUF748 domain-containing protein [Sulfurimonas microaerophilic]|uniref:DUF748 domain-containing protein n=1 Tax=Sulfurimonas microaerophilic TaxID=3058392 RepID=UPI002714EA8C|nr:DUF748 domain-containing protein [Sulfurimonas sp. hsl 1-7]
MKTIQKYLLYIVLVYAIIGFLILPFVIKSQLPKLIEQNTNTKASIETVYINPFLFKAKISGIKLYDLKEKPLLTLDSLFVDVDVYSLIYGAFNIAKLEISEPHIYIVNNVDKTINLLNIMKSSQAEQTQEVKEETNTTAPRIIIGKLDIDDAQIHYADFTRSEPFYFTFDQLDLGLKNIDTNDFNASKGAFAFYSNLGDGAFLRINTQVDGFKPLALHGHIDFKANQLYTEWTYVKDMLNFEVADGKASFNADFSINLDKLDETKVENVNIAINKLRIKPKDKSEDIINLQSFQVNNVDLLPMKQQLHIGAVLLDSLHLNVNRLKNGEIDLQNYFVIDTTNEQNQTNDDSQPWNVVVDNVDLEKISTTFTDYAVEKSVVSKVRDLNVSVKDIHLNSSKPFPYQLSTLINEKSSCRISGKIIQKPLDISSHIVCKDFDVTHYNPYIDQAARSSLKRYDILLDSLLTSLDVNLFAYDQNGTFNLKLDDSQVALNEFKLKKRSSKESLLKFDAFSFEGINFDLAKEDLVIGKINLEGLNPYLRRYKNGKLNIENIVVPKPAPKTVKKEQSKNNFHLNVKEFRVDDGKVDFYDRMLEQKSKQTISNINISVFDIDSNKNSWLTYKTSMRINRGGRVYADGKLRHTPLKQYGKFNIKNISIADINPYLNESAYVKIEDGKLALSGKTSYAKSKSRPDLSVKGKLAVSSLFINNTLDNNLLFSLNKLDVKDFTYELSPDRLYVDEVDVDSFYVDAFVDENKTLNFAKLSKKQDTNESKETKKSEPLDIKIVKVNVSNGSAKFADFSIPIKFQTDIHDLNGVIYVLSSKPGETSYINLLGEVDKYGSTTLIGSIDTSSPKLYTDLDFNFKNLELNALSGYSATFAGYKIDSGKLYLDLGYKILNSELQGKNNLVINKIILGDEIEDENVTHLPLGFVIGLLEDNEGIIDLNLPVEGNVDAPDFKYGTVIWKAFTNLVTKAVTAPFALLGSMMGIDGEELSFIEFENGKTVITPSQREKLDNIVKMMDKRPKINLGISATYDKEADLFALKREKLIAIVVKESGIKNINERENALTIDLLEDIYADLRDDDGDEKLMEKLEKEYKGEELERVYQKELLALDIEIQEVTQAELETLAKNRQLVIENYLTKEKLLNPARVTGLEINSLEDSDNGIVKNALEIKVND